MNNYRREALLIAKEKNDPMYLVLVKEYEKQNPKDIHLLVEYYKKLELIYREDDW